MNTGQGLLAIVIVSVAVSNSLVGQIEYDPEHFQVVKMIDDAVAYLENSQPGDLGDEVIMATAIYKANHFAGKKARSPFVERAIENIVRGVNELDYSTDHNFKALYFPALACVFLCEVAPKKYAREINKLLTYIRNRRNGSGAWCYRDNNNTGDTSQTQYVVLALWIAQSKGFDVDPQLGKSTLDWFIQEQREEGGWIYHNPVGKVRDFRQRQSLAAGALSSVYMLGDWLNLNPTTKGKGVVLVGDEAEEIVLPKAVTLVENEGEPDPTRKLEKKGPLVAYDRGKMQKCKKLGNEWWSINWTLDENQWVYYFLYGFERYATFREWADGGVEEVPDWYDQGVVYMAENQFDDGGFPGGSGEGAHAATALAVLFLTRGTKMSLDEIHSGSMQGGLGFKGKGKLRRRKDGSIVGQTVEKNVNDFMALVDNPNDTDLDEFVLSMEKLTLSGDEGSQSKHLANLRELVKHKKPQIRLVAVKFLAGERKMENVPALIYAVNDPDNRVAEQANLGMRLVSRKITGYEMPANPDPATKGALQKRWTEWYKARRPDAELIQ